MKVNFDESLKNQQPENKKSLKNVDFSNKTERRFSYNMLQTCMGMMAEALLIETDYEKSKENDEIVEDI